MTVSLEFLSVSRQMSGAVRVYRLFREVSLSIADKSGAQSERVMLVRQRLPQSSSSDEAGAAPQMQIAAENVLVVLDDKIYVWSAPQSTPPSATPVDKLKEEFHIVPQQSAFAVDPSGKTRLTHSVVGGTKPLEFFWLTRVDGITQDESNGDVQVDGAEIAKAAEELLLNQFVLADNVTDTLAKLRARAVDLIEPATAMLGRRPAGIPIAVPIHFKALDDAGQVCEIQYFVLIEMPYTNIAEKISKRIKEREKERLAMEAQAHVATPTGVSVPGMAPPKSAVVSPEDLPAEVARLRARVESLDAKVDLLTRQLAYLIKQMKEPPQ